MDKPPTPDAAFDAWFQARGWSVFDFQREVWAAMREGRSGLLHATTGSGKTYAVWLGALATRRQPVHRLQVLWLTPMRALAADTARALQQPLADLAPQWRVGLRTGDTPAAERARQDRRLPTALVTTPESLTLLLTRERAREDFGALQVVIVDEWHELIGNKRGVQVQLALARLRLWNPQLLVWGLSATLGNLDEAQHALLGPRHMALRGGYRAGWTSRCRSTRCCRTSQGASPGAGIWARRCCSRWSTRSSARRRRWSSPTCARRPRPGTSCCSTRGPTGPAASRCTTARWTRACANGSRRA